MQVNRRPTRVSTSLGMYSDSTAALICRGKYKPATMASLFKPPSSPFEPPSIPYRILNSPLRFLVQTVYAFFLLLRGSIVHKPPSTSAIRIICISDTHTHKSQNLPPGDVLIHAGDITNDGTLAEVQAQIDWLSSLPYDHKILICGNHDSFFDPKSRRRDDLRRDVEWRDVHYLQHSSLELKFTKRENRQLTFFGAPQIPQCGGKNFAFQYRRTDDAWSGTIPPETDVLITHTPPRHHLDLPTGLGCDYLLREVWKVRPSLHVFGHVHAGNGKEEVGWDETQRLFEKLCARSERGLLMDIIDVRAWIDLGQLIIHGMLGIFWSRVWGGDVGGSILVNAALMYGSSGQLGNPSHVVEI